MPSQTEAGKAFEFALLSEACKQLSKHTQVIVLEDTSWTVAQNAFNLFTETEQHNYTKAAHEAIKHIREIEPRLASGHSLQDTLTLQLVTDREGIKGDVRDLLFIRSMQKWEIGISAKNNHKAVKHSRLSDKIDFGKEWLGLNSSKEYFDTVLPIFKELRQLKESNYLWRDLPNKHQRFYLPILHAFRKELIRLDKENTQLVPARLLKYLIGHNDFYKVIKRSKQTEIIGFHLHGTLNKPAATIKPKFKVPQLKLPNRIIEMSFKKNSTDTLLLTCDEGWQISFRIHNASSKVEPSLKFDINLIGQPQTLYTHHLHW